MERKGRCGLIVWEPSQKMGCQREKGNQAIIYFGLLICMGLGGLKEAAGLPRIAEYAGLYTGTAAFQPAPHMQRLKG